MTAPATALGSCRDAALSAAHSEALRSWSRRPGSRLGYLAALSPHNCRCPGLACGQFAGSGAWLLQDRGDKWVLSVERGHGGQWRRSLRR